MSHTRRRSRDSSPDPLGRSITNASLTMGSSPLKQRSTGHDLKLTRPIRKSSPNLPRSPSPVKTTKQQTMIFSTPSKGLASYSGAPSSPWRIRVTVEAEPEEGDAQNQGASLEKAKRTTVMVPLKDEDEHRPVKRRRRSSKGAEAEGNTLGEANAEAGQTPRRATPRRRKQSRPGTPRMSGGNVQDQRDSVEGAGEGDEVRKDTPTRKGKRDSSTSARAADTPASQAKKRGPGRPRKSTEAAGLKQSLNNSTKKAEQATSSSKAAPVKPKKATPTKSKSRKSSGSGSLSESTPAYHDDDAPMRHGSNAADHSLEQQLTNSVKSSRISDRVPTPRGGGRTTNEDAAADPTPANDADYYSSGSENGDGGSLDSDEDCITLQLDRSLAESEDFSMVSIESLRSQREEAERVSATEAHQDEAPDETTISSETGGGSRSEARSDHVSEKEADAYTRPRSRSSDKASQQEAGGPAPEVAAHSPLSDSARPTTVDPKESASEAGPFSAFHTGTRRRLRAGLAMGELLARSEPALGGAPRGDTQRAMSASKHLQRTVIDQTSDGRLPTPADTANDSSSPLAQEDVGQQEGGQQEGEASTEAVGDRQKHYDDMSWEPSTFVEMRNGTGRGYDDMSWQPSENLINRQSPPKGYDEMSCEPTAQAVDFSFAANEVRLEAEEPHISYEEEPATSTNDIWLEEAETSFEDSMAGRGGRGKRKRPAKETETQWMRPEKRAAKAMQEQTPDLQALFSEPYTRPTRGRIPRTWRRTSGSHFLYSDENPSPEQKKDEPRTPLFLRDLRTLDEQTEEDDAASGEEQTRAIPSVERSPSPRRGILSSPLRRRESASPGKEVHFGEDTMHEYDEAESSSRDQQINQIDETANEKDANNTADSSEAEGDADATMYPDLVSAAEAQRTNLNNVRHNRHGDDISRSRQRQGGIGPLARRRNREQPSDRSSILQPNPEKQYPKLFDINTAKPSIAQPEVNKSLPPTPMQPTPKRPILKHRPAPARKAAEPTRGIFTRLSTWLYPPVPAIAPSASAQVRVANEVSTQSVYSEEKIKPSTQTTSVAAPPTSGAASISDVKPDPKPGAKPGPKAEPKSHPKLKPATSPKQPTAGIIPGWNRNHYLLLDHHWRLTFPTANTVLEEAIACHGTSNSEQDPRSVRTPPSTSPRSPNPEIANNTKSQRILPPPNSTFEASISPDLISQLGTLIHAPGEKPMQVTLLHCDIAQAFIAEASRKGVPLLSSGELTAPASPLPVSDDGKQDRDSDFPRRDSRGRIIRVREVWNANDVLVRIYGLWVRDIEVALREVESGRDERVEVLWPAVDLEGEKGVVGRVWRVLGWD